MSATTIDKTITKTFTIPAETYKKFKSSVPERKMSKILTELMEGYTSRKAFTELTKIKKTEFCMLVFLGVLMPLGQYIITRSLQDSSNPGYAKTIVSLNVLISTIVYAYFFKESSFNLYTIGGIILVLGGTYLITNKA